MSIRGELPRDRQTDVGETERQTGRETERQTGRETERQRGRVRALARSLASPIVSQISNIKYHAPVLMLVTQHAARVA